MPKNCFSSDHTFNGKIHYLTIFWTWLIGREHLNGRINSGPIIPDGNTQAELMLSLSDSTKVMAALWLITLKSACGENNDLRVPQQLVTQGALPDLPLESLPHNESLTPV